MKGIRAGDLLFYALALLAFSGAVGSALDRDLRRAGRFAAASMAAMAGLFAWLGAPWVAALQLVALVVSVAGTRGEFAGEAASPAVAAGVAAATSSAAVDEVSAGGDEAEGKPAGDGASPTTPPFATVASRWRAGVLVVAFVSVAARSVLIARWPLSAPALRGPADAAAAEFLMPAVSLAHCLVLALVLAGVGALAATTRASTRGLAMAVDTMAAAGAFAIVAVGCFVAAGDNGNGLALLVLATTLLVGASRVFGTSRGVGASLGVGRDAAMDAASSMRVANGLQVVLAGVTLALLAGVW